MILHTFPTSYIISHPDALKFTVSQNPATATATGSEDRSYSHYNLRPSLFKIHSPFIKNPVKNISIAASEIEKIFQTETLPFFLKTAELSSKPYCSQSDDNSEAVLAAKEFFSEEDLPFEKFHGENSTLTAVISEFRGKAHLFPPLSRFFNCDLFHHEFGPGEQGRYDLVVMDPPWKNKFIKRRKGNTMGYETFSVDQIQCLKLPDILLPNAIVAIWSTNSKTENILSQMLPKWGLQFIARFYWLKITTKGGLTCPFTKENGKQPFESIILATNSPVTTDDSNLGQMRVIVSIPSAINSHKPPLTDVLEHFFNRKFSSKCELFARYLLPEYTSYGNQVLKLNNLQLYNKDF